MTKDENYLRAVEFRDPEWIPYNVFIMPGTRRKYGSALEKLLSGFPGIAKSSSLGSPDYYILPKGYEKGTYTDEWGCVWENLYEGMIGQVVASPLARAEALIDYTPPDPYSGVDWEEIQREFIACKRSGLIARANGGSVFHRLTFLRGFQNLMIDIATDSEILHVMLEMILDYETKRITRYLECGANLISFGDDLGIQTGLPISPGHFRMYIGSCYERIFGLCREAGAHVYLHTDGRILDIMEDLIGYGVTILNPEDYPNGLENIAGICKGKVCIDLTFAQQFFPVYSPDEIFHYFKRVVDVLGSSKGGLIWYVEIDPDVPMENIEAILQAVMKYNTHCSG